MKKQLCLSFAALLTIALTGTVFAADSIGIKADKADFKVEVRKFNPTFNLKGKVGGAVDYQSDLIDPTDIDFRRDLNMDNDKANELRFTAGGFRFTYGSFDTAGAKTLTQDMVFDDVVYSASTTADTQMKVKYASFSFGAPAKTGNYFDALLDFKYFDIQANLHGYQDNGGSNIEVWSKYDAKLVIPSVGFRFGQKIDDTFSVNGEVSGLPLGKYGNFIDAEAAITGEVAPHTSLNFGYRYQNLSLEYENDELELGMKGPFISLEHRF